MTKITEEGFPDKTKMDWLDLIQWESGLTQTIDPWAGSYYLE